MAGSAWIGGIALVLASTAYASLLALVRRADRAYPSTDPTESTWWFGYARDITNLTGALLYVGGLVVLGWPGPLTVLGGAGLALLAYGFDYFLGRAYSVRRAGMVLTGLMGVVSVAIVAARDPLRRALGALLRTLFLMALFAGCARPRPVPTTPPSSPLRGESPIVATEWVRLAGISSTAEAEVRGPVAFSPGAGAGTFQAAVVVERAAEHVALLVVAPRGGAAVGIVPLIRVRPGAREVVAQVSRLALGGGAEAVRADVSVFEAVEPHFFATRTVVAAVRGGRVVPLLRRLIESGNDYVDKRAVFTATDLDRDGVNELVVDEKITGAERQARRLVYRLTAAGYQTADPSLFPR